MRYLVKVFTTHSSEEAAARAAVEQGIIEDAETLAGFVQGTCDEHALAKLGELGLGAISVEAAGDEDGIVPFGMGGLEVPSLPGPAPAVFFRRLPEGGFADGLMPSVTTAEGMQHYFLLRIAGAITPTRMATLAEARVSIVERRVGDWYVAKLPSRESLDALPFVTAVRLYDASETLADDLESEIARVRATGATKLPGLRVYEGIVHADAATGEAAGRISALGGRVISAGDGIVRFATQDADLQRFADIPELAGLQEVGAPRPLLDQSLPVAGIPIPPQGTGGRDGSGELIGIADTGIDDAHPDFAGRIRHIESLGRPGDWSDPAGHGTHVAGIIVGSGTASGGTLRGVAPGAEIYFQSLLDVNGRLGGLPTKIADLLQPAYAAGVRVHNDSWGAFIQARYGANSIQLDAFVHSNPDLLVVIAAGNQGSCLPGRNAEPGFVDTGSIADPASAKNGLSVGASRSPRTAGGYSQTTWGQMWGKSFTAPPISAETVSGDIDALAAFSSRGPVEDHRVKPDLVAPGTDIASTRSSSAPLRNFWGAYPDNDAYAFMGGTSMAAPIVTGAAAIVRQYYIQERAHPRPSAALLRATLVNGTVRMARDDATAPPDGDPNYHQGFGRLDLARSLPDVDAPTFRLAFEDTLADPIRDFTAAGQLRRWTLELDADGELRLCLTWTDPPAKGVQNTLLILLDPGPMLPKLSSNATVPRTGVAMPLRVPGATVDRDSDNNLHVLRVPNAKAGRYTLSVVANNVPMPLDAPRQSFALVATGQIASMTAR